MQITKLQNNADADDDNDDADNADDADDDINDQKQTCHVATNLKLQTITPDDPVTQKRVYIILFRTANKSSKNNTHKVSNLYSMLNVK